MSDHFPKNILVDVGFQGLLVIHFFFAKQPWSINNLDEILKLVYLMPSLIVVLLGLFKRTVAAFGKIELIDIEGSRREILEAF